MSFIFISHASVDKETLVRPLVESLLLYGESIWIDRPGADGLGFDQEEISAHGIEFLGSGASFSISIHEAIRASGAVLGCLSRSVLCNRQILNQELLIAQANQKLAACIVDDVEHAELDKGEFGLLNLRHLQAPRINPADVRRVARWSTDHPGEPMHPDLSRAAESVRNLIASIDRVRTEPRPLRAIEIRLLVPRLLRMPVGPPLKSIDIPRRLMDALADHIHTVNRCAAIVRQANELIGAAVTEPECLQRLIIRPGELKPVTATSGDDYWDHLLNRAGLKARSTVAAILVTPIARWAFERTGLTHEAEAFLGDLERSGNTRLTDYLSSCRKGNP